MIATIANIAAWAGCAILAFALLRDFISVERESKKLELSNEDRAEANGGK